MASARSPRNVLPHFLGCGVGYCQFSERRKFLDISMTVRHALSGSMIDIHCHILPQLDDGRKSWEIVLEMCRLAQEDGIQHIVATPHANDRYTYERREAQAALDVLRQRCTPTLTFSLGCELHLSYENLQSVIAGPREFIIGQTPYLLVELSNYGI